MRPMIGIPQCLDDRGRWRSGRDYQYLDCAYARAVDAAGGTPVYVPIQRDAKALMDRLDGLLLPGGGDFAPPHPYPDGVRFDTASAAQLDFDARLLAAALERGSPVLAICYGMQLLALHRGGTLHYDIPTDLPAAAIHRLAESDGRHAVVVAAGSRLAGILGASPEPVNSLHHQGVATPGDLRVAARAVEGLIEAVECAAAPFCIGVQWHPEKMEGPHRDRLLAAFVTACREHRGDDGADGRYN
jgi:putative glutamine amidotransferase